MKDTASTVIGIAAALGVALGGGACKRGGGAGDKPGVARRPLRFPVEVVEVPARSVEYIIQAVGSVEAFERIQVTARVAGAVERVRFAEGTAVRAGSPLVEIEPERYRLSVQSTRAAADKARAALADAEAALRRRETAVQGSPGLIPGEELETFRTRVRTAAAEVAAAEAALAQAELNLRDAYVRAAVGGVIETRSVETGQYVQPGTVLATLVRRDPLLLRFAVLADEAAALKNGMTARFRERDSARDLSARVTHVGQAADVGSRMVTVTAEVARADAAGLRPGTFAEVTVPIGGMRAAPILPTTAIRPSERGFLAYVIDGDVARERVLKLGLRTADGQVEIRGGVSVGEKVVVRGGEALRDGAGVDVKPAIAGAAAGTARP